MAELNQEDIIKVDLTVGEIKEILTSLPEQNWEAISVKARLKARLNAALEVKEHRDNHPHKLKDDYDRMQKCPYRDDWHYCCRCNFKNICTGSTFYEKTDVKKYIDTNWGK